MTSPVPRFALDSFALLAFYQAEPGGPAVRTLLRQAQRNEAELWVSTVNLGETIYLTVRRRGAEQAQRLLADFDSYSIQVIDVDRGLALAAASLKAEHPISYADCIAAALAQRLDAAVVTGDADFRRLEHLVRVEWLPTGT